MGWSDAGRTWGTTAEERQLAFPCDGALPSFNDAYYRGITIDASPAILFRWLCQLRVAPYSYDWIDNFGRRSPRELTPGIENLAVAQPVMTIFDLVDFERDRHLTLRLRTPRIFPPCAVSYLIVPSTLHRCRLLVKLVLRFRPALRDRLLRPVVPWLDWIMMRKQLMNLKTRSECSAEHGSR